jgi:ABC-2 type transport system permease protein
MAATAELTKVEGRLFLRDPIGMFFGLVFPGLLLLALGLFFPGFDEPTVDLDFRSYIDVYSPMAIALGIATLGLVTLPPILGSYRQYGILRRLRTTPVHPVRLLTAQLVVHGAVAVAASIAAVSVAVLVFDVGFPDQPLWFLVAFVMAVTSVFSIGLLIGARARTLVAGQAIGMGIYFPLLFLAGLWIPRSIMPDGLRTVSDLTPLGSAVQALDDAWFGATPDLLHLLVMAGYTIVLGFLAVRLFRWE